jgi:hypothetical protein
MAYQNSRRWHIFCLFFLVVLKPEEQKHKIVQLVLYKFSHQASLAFNSRRHLLKGAAFFIIGIIIFAASCKG